MRKRFEACAQLPRKRERRMEAKQDVANSDAKAKNWFLYLAAERVAEASRKASMRTRVATEAMRHAP